MQELALSQAQPTPMKRSVLFRRLATALWAAAMVSSLAFYQRVVLADPSTVAEQHWRAITAEDTERTLNRYREDATLWWSDGSQSGSYEGEEIALAWQTFFNTYRVEDYQIVAQKRSERLIEAKVTIKAQRGQDPTETLLVSYQAHLDENGKIVQEVWQAKPHRPV
jgi:hypothetical protein